MGGVDISWFLKLVLVDVKVSDQNNGELLSIKRLTTGSVNVNSESHSIDLSSIRIEKANFKLAYDKRNKELNLQFLIDYFSSKDSITMEPGLPWTISCKKLTIKESRFRYVDERYMNNSRGMDYSDLDISGIELSANNINVQGDSIAAHILQLSAFEKCGLNLKSFSTNALVTPAGIFADSLKIITEHSNLALNLELLYNDWSNFNDFVDSVVLKAGFAKSSLNMRDLVCFASELQGMEETIFISGKLKGSVASFSGKDMFLKWGSRSSFAGNIRMTGLPDIEETFIHLKINELVTDAGDLHSLTLPGEKEPGRLVLPDEIQRLGTIRINGKFTGFYNDFVSNATFTTDAGTVSTDILLTNNKLGKIIEYNGKLFSSGFDIGKVFNLKELGTVDLDASINGRGLTAANADFEMKGVADRFMLNGNELNQLSIDGSLKEQRFKGIIKLRDELASLDFNGIVDLSDSLPAFNFEADLTNAMLSQLKLWDRDSSSRISTHMDLDFTGNKLDNLLGTLRFNNTLYSEKERSVFMKDFLLNTRLQAGNSKRMSLNSDYLDAVFSGQYTFDDLTEYMTLVFTDYLPALALVKPSLPRLEKGSFDYTIQLKNTGPITEIFVPGLEIDPNTVISGGFNPSTGLVNVNGRSPSIQLNGFTFDDWSLQAESANGKLDVLMSCKDLVLLSDDDTETSDAHLQQFRIKSSAQNDTVRFKVNWNDLDTADINKAEFGGLMSFGSYPALSVSLDAADLIINDTVWRIIPGNQIVFDSAAIDVRDLKIGSEYQSIAINGRITDDPLDQLMVLFNNFNISQLDVYSQSWGIDFDGFLNGSLAISDVFHIPLIKASLLVKKLGFNHESLGDAEINSSWDNTRQAILLDTRIAYQGNAGVHYPLLATGAIYPGGKDENFDIDVKINNIKIKVLQPFFKGLFSRMKGFGSGEVAVSGAFSNPVLTGKVNLMRSEMLIDYLRTTYSFTGDFNFSKDLMWFSDINLADSLGNTGTTSGRIKHHAFSDWNLDINVISNNLSVLNTTFNPNEMYYGKARANGKMLLTGPINDLKLTVQAKSVKGTDVFIPINTDVTLSENDYIFYVNNDNQADQTIIIPPEPSNLSLNLALDVTKDANLELILPYRMGNIKVKGDGAVTMGIDSRGNYSMHGQYVMDKGSFLFNLQDIFSRNFEIRKGSTITFNGSPYDADINLQAVYKIKTNLSGLSSVPLELASTRIPVDCIISLTNSLYNPDIHFSIAMPDADAETQRLVFGAIDTANSVSMNQQMISLLLLNSFTSAGETSSIAASGLGFSSFGILSNQLNNWLSQISKDFDIGVNYRPGDQISAQEVELALSTQFFNDRVIVDGTFGMSNSNTITNSQNSNQWIGDVNVEVKITEDGRFRVKAFNRTNTSIDLYTGQSPYTQGVGILYRKDFDNLRDLFRRQKPVL